MFFMTREEYNSYLDSHLAYRKKLVSYALRIALRVFLFCILFVLLLLVIFLPDWTTIFHG